MDTALTAIEATGTVDEHHQLRLDTALPITGPKRVRVIVLYADEHEQSEAEWLRAATQNPVFAGLSDPIEDVYAPSDGKPFHDEG